MRNFFLLGILCLAVCCKPQEAETNPGPMTEVAVNELDLQQPLELLPQTREVLQTWKPFMDFDMSFRQLYQAENREDLILVVDDLIEKHQEVANSEPPEKFRVSQVKSRMLVVLTNLYLVKEDIEYGKPVEEELRAVVEAYNALRAQMNTQMTNTLDIKSLEDD